MAQMLGYEIDNYTLEIDESALRLKLFFDGDTVYDETTTEAAELQHDTTNNSVRLKFGDVEVLKIDASNYDSINAGGDVMASVTAHYDYLNAVVDDYGSGGGGSTQLLYQLTEAAAISAIGAQTLEPGALYEITLDGSSQGAGGDYIWIKAITNDNFGVSADYFDQAGAKKLFIHCDFTASGLVIRRRDVSQTKTLNIDTDSNDSIGIDPQNRAYGIINLVNAGSAPAVGISGLEDGDEITITSDSGLILNVNTMGLIFPGGFVGNMTLEPDERLTIRKSGSDLLVVNCTAAYSGGPREYVALLSQTSTNAPVATVLKNTLGEVPSYAYGTFGEYQLQTSASLFTSSKTESGITGNVFWDDDAGKMWFIIAERYSDQAVLIKINDFSNNGGANDLLDIWVKNIIHIRVYP